MPRTLPALSMNTLSSPMRNALTLFHHEKAKYKNSAHSHRECGCIYVKLSVETVQRTESPNISKQTKCVRICSSFSLYFLTLSTIFNGATNL